MFRTSGWIAGRAGIVATLVVMVVGIALSFAHDVAFAPAANSGGPGIVAFEFAGSSQRASGILDEWGEPGRSAAVAAIRVDYAFLVAYSLFLALAAGVVSARIPGRWGRLGRLVSGLALLAGAADAVENAALLRVIAGYRYEGIGTLAPAVAADAARIKFGLVLFVLGYLTLGLVALAVRRRGITRAGRPAAGPPNA
jgi:hypothetical protein